MKRNACILCLLLILLALCALASLCMGASGISPAEMLSAVFRADSGSAAGRILRYVRLPRTIAAMLSGAALACAGFLLQSVLRNPLAAPSVIGVNTGAGLCALICTAFFPNMLLIAPIAAFFGACAAAFLVYSLARRTGASRSTIVLAGVAVNAIFGAAMDAIVTLVPDAALNRSAFAIGGFATVTLRQLAFAAPLCIAAFAAALAFRRELEILRLGDDVAASLGLRVDFFRAVFIIAAAMLAGAAVSFSGLLGFVGLLGPHIARILMKNDSQLQLCITAAFGSLLCLFCDIIARTAFAPYELPVGIVLSFLGAPFFLYLLLNRKKRSRHGAE